MKIPNKIFIQKETHTGFEDRWADHRINSDDIEYTRKKKTIKISSRKGKGRNLQKWVCEKISKLTGIPWGKDELIASREMGQSGTDIRLIGKAFKQFPFSVECKHQETWSVPAFIEQAKENQKSMTDWLLVLKKNNQEPVIMMDADRFFQIYLYLDLKHKDKSGNGAVHPALKKGNIDSD